MRFKYYAKDKNTEYRDGIIESLNKEEALDKLYKQGLFVISIEEARDIEEALPEKEKGVNPVKLGVWILIYDVLCVGVFGFSIIFGMAMGIGSSAILYSLNFFDKIILDLFNILSVSGLILGFTFLLIGGIGLLFRKRWAQKISIAGVWSVFILVFVSVVTAGRLFGISDGIEMGGIAVPIIIPGIFIFRKLKLAFVEDNTSIPKPIVVILVIIIAYVILSVLQFIYCEYFHTGRKPPGEQTVTHERGVAEEAIVEHPRSN